MGAGDRDRAMTGRERHERLLSGPDRHPAVAGRTQLRVRLADRARDDHDVGGRRAAPGRGRPRPRPRPRRARPSPFECLDVGPASRRCRARAGAGPGCACRPRPTPIMCTEPTPVEGGHRQGRDAARGRTVVAHAATSTTSAAMRSSASGLAHASIASRHPSPARLVGDQRRDAAREHRPARAPARASPRRRPLARPLERWRPDGARWHADTAPGSPARRRPTSSDDACPTRPSRRRDR